MTNSITKIWRIYTKNKANDSMIVNTRFQRNKQNWNKWPNNYSNAADFLACWRFYPDSFKTYSFISVECDAVLGTSCYIVEEQVLTWEAASARCVELGGHMVIIESEDENQVITGLIQGNKRQPGWLVIDRWRLVVSTTCCISVA